MKRLKNKIFKVFSAVFLFISLSATAVDTPISVLIIGGGPAGLASAIEAVNKGCSVTVVEKREKHSRVQPIGLSGNTLRILKKWNIRIPEVQILDLTEEEALIGICTQEKGSGGMQRINVLETKLMKKCKELGVNRVDGEFQGFEAGRATRVRTGEKEIIIPYDILIAADGFHSRVRESLSIQMNHFGSAKGAYIVLPFVDFGMLSLKFIPIIKEGSDFLRIVKIFPVLTAISMQSPLRATKDRIRSLLENQGWTKELRAIDEGRDLELKENIPITLAQAQTFCDEEKSVILLGDATVSLSFLLGDGLNAALSSSELAGYFLEELSENRGRAFRNFNESMKELTDEVVKRSAMLFDIESLH